MEIQHNGTWGTVCDDLWGLPAAQVVCQQLGCGAALAAPGSGLFGDGSGPIFLDDVSCAGNETSLGQCYHLGLSVHNCGHHEDAGVICSGTWTLRTLVSLPSGGAISAKQTNPDRLGVPRQVTALSQFVRSFPVLALTVLCSGSPLKFRQPTTLVTLVSSVPNITTCSPGPEQRRGPMSKNILENQEIVSCSLERFIMSGNDFSVCMNLIHFLGSYFSGKALC